MVGKSEPKHILPKLVVVVVVVQNVDESHGRICKKPTFNKRKLPAKNLVFVIAILTQPPVSRAPAGNLPGRKFPKHGADRKWLVENARVETWIIGSWICNYTTVFIGDFY